MLFFVGPGRRLAGLVVILAGTLSTLSGGAQTVASIELTGLGAPPRTLTAAELARLPQTEQVAPDKQGKKHRYRGVALSALLPLLAVPQGKLLHGPVLSQVLLVTGADGYQVVFALPELAADFTDQVVLLADRCDGQPLPVGTGPYQLIVPREKRPTRWVRQVKALRIVAVKP